MPELKLLPCPFCGGEADLRTECFREHCGNFYASRIICTQCHASIRNYMINEDDDYEENIYRCINAWNTRANN